MQNRGCSHSSCLLNSLFEREHPSIPLLQHSTGTRAKWLYLLTFSLFPSSRDATASVKLIYYLTDVTASRSLHMIRRDCSRGIDLVQCASTREGFRTITSHERGICNFHCVRIKMFNRGRNTWFRNGEIYESSRERKNEGKEKVKWRKKFISLRLTGTCFEIGFKHFRGSKTVLEFRGWFGSGVSDSL